MQEVALVVNAGGTSRRMGQNKALLPVPPYDTSLAAHIVNRLAPVARSESKRQLVLVGEPALGQSLRGLLYPVQALADRWPGTGALGGLTTGLAAVRGWAMCVACDMPFVSPAVMAFLLEYAAIFGTSQEAEPVLGVVPVAQGYIQPFHAVYHARLAELLQAELAAGERRIEAALGNAPIRYVDEDTMQHLADVPRAFTNVNTPAEWAEALAHWP